MANEAIRYDRGSPTIEVVNRTKLVPAAHLRRIVRAVQKQIDDHFFPLWGWRARLVVVERPSRRRMSITMKGKPDLTRADAYHFIDGLPQTYVFTRDEKGRPVEPADYESSFSHEALEMIADPGVNLFAAGYCAYQGHRHRAWIPYEVCDPVQGATYRIDGITMSGFVVPEWFEGDRKRDSMKFSYRCSVHAPFEIAPAGYVDAFVNGRTVTTWGPEAKRRKVRHRLQVRKRHHG
jgi:hypothetical protein